jgi:hypothetical protein
MTIGMKIMKMNEKKKAKYANINCEILVDDFGILADSKKLNENIVEIKID